MIVSATAFVAALIGIQGILVVKLADLLGGADVRRTAGRTAHGRYAGIA